MKRLVLLSFAGLVAAVLPVIAQPTEPAPVEEKATALGHDLYAIAGVGANTGGNTTLAVAPKGLVVVDTQFPQFFDKLHDKIRSISDKPILYVIDTHYHADHSGGNEGFHAKDNAIIVAHPQVIERMIHPQPRDGRPAPAPSPKQALPDMPYKGDESTLEAGNITVQLVHPAAHAHTDGDTVVIFPAANVIATGDFVVTNAYPLIDIESGGKIEGMIAGTDFLLAHCDAGTKIVPGHGPVTDKVGLTEYRDMLVKARDLVAKAKAAGMTEQQVMDAHLLKDLDPRWNGSDRSARFAAAVYKTLP